MKRLIMVVMSLVVLVGLNTMGSSFLKASTAAQEAPCSTITSTPTPTVAKPGKVSVDGCITIWSDAPGFNGPKIKPLHTSAVVARDSAGDWNITIADLSIAWNANTQLMLQDGKVASGVFLPSTNSIMMNIPLKGLPLVKTITFKVSTDDSATTTDGQIIRGSRVDLKGNTTLVGSKSRIGLFFQAQMSIQCKLSPWPLSI